MKFTLFWLTGKSEIVTGNSIANAFNNAGYSQGALQALDFYESGDQTNSYQWNSKTRNWEPKEVSYYQKELDRININNEYPPSIVVFDGNGDKTKQLSLNKDSAKDLIRWLSNNFV